MTHHQNLHFLSLHRKNNSFRTPGDQWDEKGPTRDLWNRHPVYIWNLSEPREEVGGREVIVEKILRERREMPSHGAVSMVTVLYPKIHSISLSLLTRLRRLGGREREEGVVQQPFPKLYFIRDESLFPSDIFVLFPLVFSLSLRFPSLYLSLRHVFLIFRVLNYCMMQVWNSPPPPNLSIWGVKYWVSEFF